MEQLERLLSYYEEIIDVDHHRENIEFQKSVMRFEKTDRICMRFAYPSKEFVPYTMEEIHEDMGKMMFNELLACAPDIETNSCGIPMIRANYGVGALPCAFGLTSKIINGNMPWVEHVPQDEVREIVAKGVPEDNTGFGQKIIETYEFFRETLSKYPKCNEVIKLYHPDYQGPLDTAHLIYGPDIYVDMYAEPELVHELLELVTETYIKRMKKIKPYLNDEYDEFCCHWHDLFPGKILIRDDSAVNLSPDMYHEFAQAYDDKIMQELGQASIHFCGRADHWVFDMVHSENVVGLNNIRMPNVTFGQEYLDFLAPQVMEKGIPMVGYGLEKSEFDTMDFEKYKTGISFFMSVQDKQEAEEILARCCQ